MMGLNEIKRLNREACQKAEKKNLLPYVVKKQESKVESAKEN